MSKSKVWSCATVLSCVFVTGCPSPSPSPDAADVLSDSADASMDVEDVTSAGDAAPDGPPAPPPSEALPAVSVGEMELRARTHGGFELAVGGRVVLASVWGPVAAQRWNERVENAFGNWTFRRSMEREERPGANATATVDGMALVLRTSEGGVTGELRFTRPSMDHVEIRASIAGAMAGTRGTALRFRCDPDAHFMGFGEQFNFVDHRGRRFGLFVSEQGLGRDPARPSIVSGSPETTYYPLPFFIDPRGIGMMVETDARTIVDLCRAAPDEFMFAPEQSEPLVARVYTGPTVPDVMRAWTEYQGRTMVPPAWAVEGVWLGVQGGPDALRGYLRTAQAANVPVSVIWAQDWVGRKDLGLGNVDIRYHWTADAMWYPNLSGLISEFGAQGVRFLGYFNPFVMMNEDQWAEGAREGFLPRNAMGGVATFDLPHGTGTMVDLTNPRAVDWYKGFARRAMDLGQVGWMQDYGEWLPLDAVLSDGRDARRFHNRYPVEWHRAASEALRERYPSGDWVMFSRSGWLQDARHTQIVWAGDQEASWSPWDGLPTVVPALVSLGMSGVGYVTHDVGGYYGGPSSKELYQRWIELGAFTPVMRTHEGLQRDRNWNWDRDAETIAFFSRFGRVHRALAPTFRALGDEHQRTGMPILRAMGLQFPSDARMYAITDQYMIGDEMLVAPVVTAGQTARRVVFPAGTWHSVWDPTLVVNGPVEQMVPAPIGAPPVFTRMPRADLAAVR